MSSWSVSKPFWHSDSVAEMFYFENKMILKKADINNSKYANSVDHDGMAECCITPVTALFTKWAVTRDFQQCGISTSVYLDEPLQPPFKLNDSKWSLVSSLTVIEYSSDLQWLWSDCAYAHTILLEISRVDCIYSVNMHWVTAKIIIKTV